MTPIRPLALLVPACLAFAPAPASAGPYAGIQYLSLSGTRSSLDYETSQINAVFGYEFAPASGLRHAIQYVGPISSSTGQLGPFNVETTVLSVQYRLLYLGFFGKIGVSKLDRQDRDLEAAGTDRALSYGLGYEYAFDGTTSVHVAWDGLRNGSLSMSGFSIGATFRF